MHPLPPLPSFVSDRPSALRHGSCRSPSRSEAAGHQDRYSTTHHRAAPSSADHPGAAVSERQIALNIAFHGKQLPLHGIPSSHSDRDAQVLTQLPGQGEVVSFQ